MEIITRQIALHHYTKESHHLLLCRVWRLNLKHYEMKSKRNISKYNYRYPLLLGKHNDRCFSKKWGRYDLNKLLDTHYSPKQSKQVKIQGNK